MAWVAVAFGGALGSVLRHGVNRLTASRWTSFPVGTVVVNLSGCFVIGLLAGLIATKRLSLPFYAREFVFVGILGGFTTFSTFSLETVWLAQQGYAGRAAAYVALSLALSLAAMAAGLLVGRGVA